LAKQFSIDYTGPASLYQEKIVDRRGSHLSGDGGAIDDQIKRWGET
jgi:hypothetical protein